MREKILIVEDEEGIRELMKLYLENNGYDVKTAGNGKEALQILHEPFQLILLDIEMPKMDGFTLCKEIRKTKTVPIIFISGRREIHDKLTSFELGADDYMTKPFKFAELEARIKANIRRYDAVPDDIGEKLTYGRFNIFLDRFECHINGEHVPLSAREIQILIVFAKHPKQIFSPEQLYKHVWGLDKRSDTQTIKVHMSNLRKKLALDEQNPPYIETVRGMGYRFMP